MQIVHIHKYILKIFKYLFSKNAVLYKKHKNDVITKLK